MAELTAQQRTALFNLSTRQTEQTGGTQRGYENSLVSFEIPKARFLAKVRVLVEATIKVKSTNSTVPLKNFSPFDLISKIDLNLNNGFSPYTLTGKELTIYNSARLFPNLLVADTKNKRSPVYVENGASVTGIDNKVEFVLELPITVNERDMVGLILLQNKETMVDLRLTIGQAKDVYILGAGESAELVELKLTPMYETYTIPSSKEAFPDISVMKIVQARNYSLQGSSSNTLSLLTGTIYRKIFLYITDASGNPMGDDDFNGQIDLLFNTSDIPYNLHPKIWSKMNAQQLGYSLPKGVYMLDFSYQGIANYGGSRDYIDTEKLTQFEIRLNPKESGILTVIPEMLTRLT